MSDPFAEAERAKRADEADEARRAGEHKAKTFQLYEEMARYKDKLHSYDAEFQLVSLRGYLGEDHGYAVLVYLRKGPKRGEIGDMNAIVYRPPCYGSGPGAFSAEGGVSSEKYWSEESHCFLNEYYDAALGTTVEEAVSRLARDVVKRSLPAAGSYADRLHGPDAFTTIKRSRPSRRKSARAIVLPGIRRLMPLIFLVVAFMLMLSFVRSIR